MSSSHKCTFGKTNNCTAQQVKRYIKIVQLLCQGFVYCRLQRDPVLNYTEDSGPILLIPESLQNDFYFMEEVDIDFGGYRVTLTIVAGSNDDEGQLILPSDFSASDVTISGANTSQITVEHPFDPLNIVPTPLDSFNAVFRAVQISFNDNTPRRYTFIFTFTQG